MVLRNIGNFQLILWSENQDPPSISFGKEPPQRFIYIRELLQLPPYTDPLAFCLSETWKAGQWWKSRQWSKVGQLETILAMIKRWAMSKSWAMIESWAIRNNLDNEERFDNDRNIGQWWTSWAMIKFMMKKKTD